ncbi:hypothetical protein GPECTOR_12g469 [Gonium pectorale]|uniref:Methyltransferase domain-containing protein n=1 Tax=Gonium pectorale TaxID=33097 RepID=A0A150GNR9_GONPE|nr:hypothetical protein GPECTOR_12g469 [Gonium pectorale]|eukprot:KXZ51506.1 hypothetical protein GPECTOR_12g469 [Gonium pectorale]
MPHASPCRIRVHVTTFTARQSLAANHPAPAGDEGALQRAVGPLLEAGGVGSVLLRTAAQDLTVQVTKRGKGILHRAARQGRAPLVRPEEALSHDRRKDTPIPADAPHPFLQRIGFQTENGKIRATMQDKFSQVNDFLKLLGHTGIVRELMRGPGGAGGADAAAGGTEDAPAAPAASAEPAALAEPSTSGRSSTSALPRAPLQILDCGCGSSHLSFGTFHYLNHVLGVAAELTGVDVNAGLMAKGNQTAAQLGLEGAVRFVTSPIGDYSPPVRPDIVLALHACDTATDDALALAVKQSAPLIMAVPCCHAALHKQLSGQPPSARPPWAPLLRHGILKQRQLDLLTDSLRAALLRVAGYRTDVVEFVSTEHTPRNLLIRAVRPAGASGAGNGPVEDAEEGDGPRSTVDHGDGASRRQRLAAAREYIELRDYWRVTPKLEVLLREEVGPLLQEAAAALEQRSGEGRDASDADEQREEEH